MNNKLREILKFHEGLRLKPYLCTAGRWTIGYGHNLEAHNEASPSSITIEQAERYLDQDMASAEKQCAAKFPFYSRISDVRKAVLIDMCFNMGINGIAGFKMMVAALTDGKYPDAAIEMMDSKWSKQVGYRAVRLMLMMAKDKWPDDIKA